MRIESVCGLAMMAVLSGCVSAVDAWTAPPPADGREKAEEPIPPSMPPARGSMPSSFRPDVPYPAGVYGLDMGDTLSGDYEWTGYAPGEQTPSPRVAGGGAAWPTLRVADLFDADGSRGINALFFVEQTAWCGPSQSQAQTIVACRRGDWDNEGVVVVTLMWQDDGTKPATTQTALDWRDRFGDTMDYVVADPNCSLYDARTEYPGRNELPINVVVDPRSMKIVDRENGSNGECENAVAPLAQQNKN